MYFRRELAIAMREVQIAWNHFNNADPEFVEAAILKLNAAEKKCNILYSLSGAGNGVHFEEVSVKLYANVINQLMPCTKPPRLDDEVAVLYCDDRPILVHKYRDSKKEDISLAYGMGLISAHEAAGWMSEYSEPKEKSNDGLVTCYANLIIKGTKTLDDVPMAIREKVEKQLEEVEFNNTFYKSLCETATKSCLATYKTEAKAESISKRENPIMKALRKFVEFLNELVDLFIADWD